MSSSTMMQITRIGTNKTVNIAVCDVRREISIISANILFRNISQVYKKKWNIFFPWKSFLIISQSMKSWLINLLQNYFLFKLVRHMSAILSTSLWGDENVTLCSIKLEEKKVRVMMWLLNRSSSWSRGSTIDSLNPINIRVTSFQAEYSLV